MAKMTLLEAVQQILSDADSDNVNSINDTVESTQCAYVVRDVFNQIVDLHDLEHIKTVTSLDATSAATPNVMQRPEGLHTIEWVQYDKALTAGGAQKMEYVHYLEPDEFLERIQGRDTDSTNIDEITLGSGVKIPVRTDKHPEYYTVFDTGSDELVFDSYYQFVDSNLQEDKSIVYGVQRPILVLDDASTFTVPKHLETLILREARAMFFDLYKDGATREIDRSRRRMEVRAQRQRNIIKNTDNDNYPDYGRPRS